MRALLLLLLLASPARAAFVAVAPKPVQELMNRLIADGDAVQRAEDVLLALQKTDRPKAGVTRQLTIGLVETAPDPAAGRIGEEGSMYRDLAHRRVFTRLEVQVLTTTVGKDGKGTVASRIYFVALDAKLYEIVSQRGAGALDKDGAFQPDAATIETKPVKPADAKADWDKLVPELLRIHRVIEA